MSWRMLMVPGLANNSLIEGNLDSIVISPRRHREDLIRHVNRPRLERDIYCIPTIPEVNQFLRALQRAWDKMNIELDPYVLNLRQRGDLKKADKIVLTRKTFCQERMKKFCATATHIFQELGHWAVEFFISTAISSFRMSASDEKTGLKDLGFKEKQYLLSILKSVTTSKPSQTSDVSDKTRLLIQRLKSSGDDLSGIIFVKQRATVAVLQELLAAHPATSHLKCGTFIGTSNNTARKSEIGELVDPRHQQNTLDDFRGKKYNIIIATSVLEEGIDIPACHLVICHDKPPNLKSFVQRRGRARQKDATFVIMFEKGDTAASNKSWEALEQAMVKQYQSDSRMVREAREIEETEETSDIKLRTGAGALLTFDNAMAHLHHFCAKGYKEHGADPRPVFTFEQRNNRVRATVTLPNSFDQAVRRAQGQDWWCTEKAAKKDAAFHAYEALYLAGLVNENMLPNDPAVFGSVTDDDLTQIQLPGQINPWRGISNKPDWHEITLSIKSETSSIVLVKLVLPSKVFCTEKIKLRWNDGTIYTAELGWPVGIDPPPELNHLTKATNIIFQSIHSKSMESDGTPLVLINPCDPKRSIQEWNDFVEGVLPASERLTECSAQDDYGILRDKSDFEKRYVPLKHLASESKFEASRFTGRRYFRAFGTQDKKEHIIQKIPVERCTMERLPYRYAMLSLFLPTIMQSLEAHFIANQLRLDVLPSLQFQNLEPIVTAITASSADPLNNYQRLEFLGDTLLKYITSVQLFYKYTTQQENFLSVMRTSLVSNSFLTQVAVKMKLSRYVIRNPLERIWTPPGFQNVDETLDQSFSAKMLADIVEALIGAAYEDGGLPSAATCATALAPEIMLPDMLKPPQYYLEPSFNVQGLTELEEMIGYEFAHPRILFEAITHPSYTADTKTRSYQRLEFLGDAILDRIVAESCFENGIRRSHGDMTNIKSAVVNNDLLKYICLKFCQTKTHEEINQIAPQSFRKVTKKKEKHIWEFMRLLTNDSMATVSGCLDRFMVLEKEIELSLLSGKTYPWIPLAGLHAPKSLSDLIESLLGAIFVDSAGDTSACKSFLQTIGLMEILNRYVKHQDIDLLHPKTRLGILADTKSVEYVKTQDENGWLCYCKVDGEEKSKVTNCVSQEEAILLAADTATKALQREATNQ